MKLVESGQLQSVESRLMSALDRQFEACCVPGLADAVKTYVANGGKRLRPQLVLWTCQQATGHARGEAALDAAVAWELFHAFLLVHDDIIDGSAVRRGRPALHRVLSGDEQIANSMGIIAGDLLFGAAMGVLGEIDADPATHRELLRLFTRVTTLTGLGQAIDVHLSTRPLDELDEQTLLREYHWKTAAYTFEGPMLSGALLAGLDASARRCVSDFALSLGQAYQLQNDLLDLATPAHAGCDLVQGKRTVTIIRHRSGLDAEDRRRLDDELNAIGGANGHAVAMAEDLRQRLIHAGAVAQTRSLIERLLAEARLAARAECMPARLAAGLTTMLDALGESYFADAQAV